MLAGEGTESVEVDPDDALEASTGVSGLPIDRATLRALSTPSGRRALGMTALLLGATLGLASLARAQPSWWVRAPLYVALGLVVNGLVQLGHEAWHHNLFRARWHNTLYGHLFSALFGVSFLAARHAHLRHHWYNRTARDPDAYNAGSGFTVWLQFYTVVFAGLVLAPLHFNVLYPMVAFSRREWGPHLAMLGLYALGYGLFWCSVGCANAGLVFDLWAVPILCAAPFNGLKSIADHYGNTWAGGRFHTATTVRTQRWLSWLWSGLNFHLDHHLFPRVPGHHLAALHARLGPSLEARRAPVFEGYLRVWWRAFWAGPTYLDDPSAFLRRSR